MCKKKKGGKRREQKRREEQMLDWVKRVGREGKNLSKKQNDKIYAYINWK